MALLNNNPPAGTPCDTAAALQGETQVYRKKPSLATRKYASQKKSATPCQLERRATVKHCVTLWKSLTGAQKTAWQTLALATPFLNPCGQTIFLSSYNMFMRVNMLLIQFGTSYLLADPPPAYTPPAAPLSYTLQHDRFCFFPRPIATLSFTPVPGTGLQVFGRIVVTALDTVLLKTGYHLFSTITEFDPLYGPDPGNPNPPSTRRKFLLAVHLGWERVKKIYGGACSPPTVA